MKRALVVDKFRYLDHADVAACGGEVHGCVVAVNGVLRGDVRAEGCRLDELLPVSRARSMAGLVVETHLALLRSVKRLDRKRPVYVVPQASVLGERLPVLIIDVLGMREQPHVRA